MASDSIKNPNKITVLSPTFPNSSFKGSCGARQVGKLVMSDFTDINVTSQIAADTYVLTGLPRPAASTHFAMLIGSAGVIRCYINEIGLRPIIALPSGYYRLLFCYFAAD